MPRSVSMEVRRAAFHAAANDLHVNAGAVWHNPPFQEAFMILAIGPRPWQLAVARTLSLVPSHHAQARQAAAANTVDIGVIAGAPYYIEIPVKWNKGLVLHTHGYTPGATSRRRHDSPQHKAFRDVFLSRGFAFAASDYSRQGWAVKEGIEETEALRRHFVAKHGQPSETYITGHSMGGHITMAILERHPEAYQGGLPLCGPLGGALDFLTAGPFDMLVTFEAIFPGTIGSPYEARPGTRDRINAALAAHPERAARFAQHYDRTVSQLTGASDAVPHAWSPSSRGGPVASRSTIATASTLDSGTMRR